jgi:hypothetical protein
MDKVAESLGTNTLKFMSSRDLSRMNYNICIIWWRVIAPSCNKSLVFERLKLISLRDLCVFMFMFMFVRVYVCACLCLCVFMFVRVYVCACVFMFVE